jgi:serine/threonine protein kinase
VGRPAADPEGEDGRSWGFEEGDEVLPGRSVLAKLGGGHRFEAFLAWDGHLRTTVVAKVVRPDRVTDRDTLRGLADEAAALAALNHPVIVRGFGAELDGPRPQLLLEHLEGPRLSSLVRRYGPLGREQLAPLAIQLAAAVHYLHAEGWVHLDIKPANVIMGAPPRLIDLSVACPVAAAGAIDQPIGTDSYMAPEQCLPGELGPVGPAADVFGLGVTLYRAATAGRPWEPGSADADRGRPEERWPQLALPPLPLEADLPAAAAAAIESCLAFEPSSRPAPGEVGDAFEAMLGALPPPRLSRVKPRWS